VFLIRRFGTASHLQATQDVGVSNGDDDRVASDEGDKKEDGMDVKGK
jgi:hypothetical protein